jgi:hypothetical protein
MNQEEVAGLQALAKQHGASLSINPHTGMPEAFSLGKVFKAVLPIAAGFALGPGGFASGLFESGSFMGSALGTGLLVGGATAALTGNIGTGIMAGLGAYGGHGLSDVWSKMGSSAVAAAPTASTNMGLLAKETGAPLVGAPNNFTALGAGNTGALSGVPLDPVASFAKPMAFDATYGASTIAPSGSAAGSNFIKEGVNLANTTNAGLTASAPKTGLSNLYSNFTDAGGKASQLYMPAAGTILAGVQPKDFYDEPLAAQEKQVYEQTSVDSMGRPVYGYNLASAYNPYRNQNLGGVGPLKFAAKGGPINSYAEGGVVQPTIQSGGLRDLYGSSDNQAQALSTDGFGLGRLSNLASAQELQQAKTLGYARGGYLNGAGDGMSDSIPATIEGKQPARLADGEFVVPADVVSHLGNGSSKAGSKRLYAMMQKVRKARTGNPKQGKQINPNKYLMA